jgi:predicted outer membrane protein
LLLGATLPVDAAQTGRLLQVSARSLTHVLAADPLAADTLRPAERAFLSKALESSRQQVRLAEIGVSQATNAQVRSHAQQRVADYRTLNGVLDALIRRRGGIAGAPVGETSETYKALLGKAGADFDREFVRTAADATNDVLTAFEQIASESKDEDVRELAAAQLPMLRAHRSEIIELQKAVY